MSRRGVPPLVAVRRAGLVLAAAVLASFAAPTAQAASVTASSGATPTTVAFAGGPAGAANVIPAHPAWASLGGSSWIGYRSAQDGPAGPYVYRATLTLPPGAQNGSIAITWYGDDCSSVSVNGAASGPCAGNFAAGGVQTVTRPAIVGANALRFDVTNGGGPTGLLYRAVATYDADTDLDGVVDPVDNCPAVPNAGQANLDGDAFGDACDDDIDGDFVLNANDAFPLDPARAATGTAGTGGDPDGDQVTVAKAEDALALEAGETRTATLSCPAGGIMSDATVRVDAVDQGTGTPASVQVLEQRSTAPGTFTFTIRNTASGRAQVKLTAVCLPAATSAGTPLVVGAPLATPPTSVGPGPQTARLSCANGQIAIAPGFVASSGVARLIGVAYVADQGAVGTPAQRYRTIELTWVGDPAPATVVGSVRCLSATLGSGAGSRALALSTRTGGIDAAPGQTASGQVVCADDAKGIVATYALAPGLLLTGFDPQPKTRVFQVFNPTGGGLHADLGLLCLGDRTGRAGTTTVLRSLRLRSAASLSRTGRAVLVTATCAQACTGRITLRAAGSSVVSARGVVIRAAKGTSRVVLRVLPGQAQRVRRARTAQVTLVTTAGTQVQTVTLRR
ncbi:thrombospondin type 3 repeat-containing protein [Paraconexibacter sp. AEG42_29]